MKFSRSTGRRSEILPQGVLVWQFTIVISVQEVQSGCPAETLTKPGLCFGALQRGDFIGNLSFDGKFFIRLMVRVRTWLIYWP